MFQKDLVKKAFSIFPIIRYDVNKISTALSDSKIIHKIKDEEDVLVITGFYQNVFFICFQGSIQKQDWIDNIKAYKKYDCEINGKVVGDVHFGFYTQYKIIRDDIIAAVNSLPLDIDTIYIIGHSLGGALSAFYTLLIKSLFPKLNIYNITIGSPRTGNRMFAKQFKNINTLRFIHGDDCVPHVPPAIFFFKHIAKGIYLPCVNKKKTFFGKLLSKLMGSFDDHDSLFYETSFNNELVKGSLDKFMK